VKRLTHPATVIAALALFVAFGGTAALAGGLISGNRITNHSIAESKLTKKAIKGLKGQHGPRGATGASGPQGPAGSSNSIRWNMTSAVRDVVGDSSGPDLSNLNDRTGIVTLATVGTLKLDGICWDDGTDTFGSTFIETTEDGARTEGSFGDGQTPLNVSDGPVQISPDIAENDTASDSFFGPDSGGWAAENAAGTIVLDGVANQAAPNLSGGANATCAFSGYLVEVAGAS
jgi:hypothetical protein